MNKFMQLLSDLNDLDISLIFENKNIIVKDDGEEIMTAELPLGMSAYEDVRKMLKNAVSDEMAEMQDDYHLDEERFDSLIKLNQCLSY